MKKYISILMILGLLAGCTSRPESTGKIKVAASITPLADFVRQIAGDDVALTTIIPTGANVHHFEFTPGLMREISTADLLVFNGLGLEFWADKAIDNTPDAAVVFAARGIPNDQFAEGQATDAHVLAEHDHGEHQHVQHDHGSHEHHANPHVWLDPVWAKHMVHAITDELVKLMPERAEVFQQRRDSYLEKLDSLDADIRDEISTWSQKRFVCFHPAWEYFADRYGLVQAGVIEKRPGAEPTPRDIIEVIETVKEIEARVIFTESQFPSKVSEMIAAESNTTVVPLDPLGGTSETDSYINMMRYNVRQMKKGLK